MRSPPRCDSAGRARVVITGLGVVTTIGDTPARYCKALTEGLSGITKWKQMDPRIDSKIGGDLSGFNLADHLREIGSAGTPLARRAIKLLRGSPLSPRLAGAAALQAFGDARFADAGIPSHRVGHVLGGHNLNTRYIFENCRAFLTDLHDVEVFYGMMGLDTDVLAVISELLTIHGPTFQVGNACASGNLALLSGLDLIRGGRADAVLVTGASTTLEPVTLYSWGQLNAMSIASFNDEPERASRPFDARREGFVPSDGSAAVMLETLAGAQARDAQIYAEVLGVGSSSDACRLPRPSVEGEARAIRSALEDARIAPEQVDYVNAHAASTRLGDAVEIEALKTVLGEHAYRIPVNSTKSMVGHTLTAAGIVELVATVLQMENGVVHPTINQEEKDPALDLDFVPNQAREHSIRVAISNGFGFGGLNSCVVVGRGAA